MSKRLKITWWPMSELAKKLQPADKFDVSSSGSVSVNTDAVVNSPLFREQIIQARKLVRDNKIAFSRAPKKN